MFPLIKNFLKSSTKNQYLAACVINLLAVAHGCVIGWTSPTIPYLRSDNKTHIETGSISSHEASWIGSCNFIGAFIAIFLIGFIIDKIGEKKTLLLLVFPNLISWTLILLSTQVWHLYAARIIAGLSSGGMMRIIPIFTGKIAESKVRGTLGSFYPLAILFGNLVMYILAGFLHFHHVPLIAMSLPVAFFFGLLFLPETPHFHLLRNENEKALKSLMFYRNCEVKNDLIEEELETFEKLVKMAKKEKVSVEDFNENRNGLLMCFLLMSIGGFSGNVVIVAYTTDIFTISGSSLSPITSTIIIGTIQLFGVYITTLTNDIFGRKFLMSISCFGTFLFLFIMATYDFMIDQEIIENSISLNWIPIVSLSMAVFVMSIGIVPIPFIMVTELVQFKIREASMMISMALLMGFSFISLKIFPLMMELINLYGCMWLYSGICLFSCLISVFVLPETKGKKLFEA